MKITLKCLLIVAFIFSFFLFLSKPVNAQLFTPVIPNEILAPKTLGENTYSNYALIYGQNNQGDPIGWNLIHIRDGATVNLRCGEGAYAGGDKYIACGHTTNNIPGITHIVHNTYYFYDDGVWVSKNGYVSITIGVNDNRANLPSYYILSTVDVAFYIGYKVVYYPWMYGGTGTTYMANTYYPLFSANLNYGFSGAPVVAPTYDRFMEYRDNTQSSQWLRVEFNGDMTISSSFAVGDNELNFSGDWRLYAVAGVDRVLLTSSSSFYPPHLYIADVNNPCALVLRSNWVLKDENGVAVCFPTVNPIVEEIAKNFTGIVNYDTNTDLGIFEPIEPVIAWLGKVVDDVARWFHGLWVNFLNLIIPMPDFLTYAFAEVKHVASEKFAQIDVSSLNDFRELDADTMPNITTSLMGVSVTVVNFDLIKPHIDLLRSIMAATVGLFLIIFNVNQVNKLLSDNSVTEE